MEDKTLLYVIIAGAGLYILHMKGVFEKKDVLDPADVTPVEVKPPPDAASGSGFVYVATTDNTRALTEYAARLRARLVRCNCA